MDHGIEFAAFRIGLEIKMERINSSHKGICGKMPNASTAKTCDGLCLNDNLPWTTKTMIGCFSHLITGATLFASVSCFIVCLQPVAARGRPWLPHHCWNVVDCHVNEETQGVKKTSRQNHLEPVGRRQKNRTQAKFRMGSNHAPVGLVLISKRSLLTTRPMVRLQGVN
jgi:hypothetical protein